MGPKRCFTASPASTNDSFSPHAQIGGRNVSTRAGCEPQRPVGFRDRKCLEMKQPRSQCFSHTPGMQASVSPGLETQTDFPPLRFPWQLKEAPYHVVCGVHRSWRRQIHFLGPMGTSVCTCSLPVSACSFSLFSLERQRHTA